MTGILPIGLKRDELSEKLGGGIPTHSVVLIEGQDGAGKSIMAQRFTFSFLKEGHSVSYISTELDTVGFVNQMASVKYEITDYLLDDKLTFISMFPGFGNVKLRKDFMDKLLEAKEIFEKEIIIFDSLSFMLIRKEISFEKSFELIQLFKKLTAQGKTVFFCVDPTTINEELLQIFRSISDIYLSISIEKLFGDTIRKMTVQRFKRAPGAIETTIAFKVDPGNGFATILASLA